MFIPSASWYTSVSPLQVDSSNQIKRSSQKQHKIWWPYIRHVISGNNFRRYCNPTAMMTISIEHLLHQLRSSKSLPILWISKKTFQRFPKIAPRLNPELFQQASWISSWWFQLKNISQTGSIPLNNWAKNENIWNLKPPPRYKNVNDFDSTITSFSPHSMGLVKILQGLLCNRWNYLGDDLKGGNVRRFRLWKVVKTYYSIL